MHAVKQAHTHSYAFFLCVCVCVCVCVCLKVFYSSVKSLMELVFFCVCLKFFLCFFFFFFFFFLGLYLWHVEVPRLGGWIKAAAAGLHDSHRNARSEPCLWLTQPLQATKDPSPTEQGQGVEPTSSWILVRFLTCWTITGTPCLLFSILGNWPRQDRRHTWMPLASRQVI